LVVYPTIYRVLYILSGGCGHLKNIPKTPSHLDVLGTALPLGGVSGCRLTRLGLQGNAIEVGRFDFSVLLWNTKSGKVRRAFEIIIPVIYIYIIYSYIVCRHNLFKIQIIISLENRCFFSIKVSLIL